MPTHEQELLRAARAVARLQAQIRKYRRHIKAAQADLRIERKHLRALANRDDQAPDVMPSRLFGGGVGMKRPAVQVGTCLHGNRLDETCLDCRAMATGIKK